MMNIVFLLPTCEPDEMFKWLYPSLDNLKGCESFIQFSITFQPPYTEQECIKVVDKLRELGFEVKWDYKDYKVIRPYTPLIRMRNDCAMRFPDADIYGLLDDDMSFNKPSVINYFKKAIKMFEKDPELSVLALNNAPRKYENYFATNSGLLFRGGKYYGFEGLVPHKLSEFKNYHTLVPYEGEDLINLFGGFQDKFCAMIRLCAGHKPDQLCGIPVEHVENRKQRGAQSHGWEAAKYEQGSVSKFIEKYFNRFFLLSYSLTLFEPNLMEEIFPNYYTNEDTYLICK